MQNSYNVAALTKNDMMNRPIKQTPGKKQIEVPKRPVIPGLKGRYTQQADGSVLVHDGSYSPKKGVTTTLHESTLTFKGPYVSSDEEEDAGDDGNEDDEEDDEEDDAENVEFEDEPYGEDNAEIVEYKEYDWGASNEEDKDAEDEGMGW